MFNIYFDVRLMHVAYLEMELVRGSCLFFSF